MLAEIRKGRQFPKMELVVSKAGSILGESKKLPSDSHAFLLKELKKALEEYRENFDRGLSLLARAEMLMPILRPERTPEGKSYRLRHKRFHIFPDGAIMGDIFALNVEGVGEVGLIACWGAGPAEVKINFIQAIAKADLPKANRILGKPWFEAIGDKLVLAQGRLFDYGSMLRLPADFRIIGKEFRDRYLASDLDINKPYFNPNRRRVRELLGEKANLLPSPKPRGPKTTSISA
jgi:hypothetical protein